MVREKEHSRLAGPKVCCGMIRCVFSSQEASPSWLVPETRHGNVLDCMLMVPKSASHGRLRPCSWCEVAGRIRCVVQIWPRFLDGLECLGFHEYMSSSEYSSRVSTLIKSGGNCHARDFQSSDAAGLAAAVLCGCGTMVRNCGGARPRRGNSGFRAHYPGGH